MPEKAPAEPPSRWTVINDYSKTVVTLSGGLLGFLATFMEKLQIAEGSSTARDFFIAAIVFLLLAIASALAVAGRMDRYLRISADGILTLTQLEQRQPKNGISLVEGPYGCAKTSLIFPTSFFSLQPPLSGD